MKEEKDGINTIYLFLIAPYKKYKVKVELNSFELSVVSKPRHIVYSIIKGTVKKTINTTEIEIDLAADSAIQIAHTVQFGIITGIALLTTIQIFVDAFNLLYLIPHFLLFSFTIFMAMNMHNEYLANKRWLTKLFEYPPR